MGRPGAARAAGGVPAPLTDGSTDRRCEAPGGRGRAARRSFVTGGQAAQGGSGGMQRSQVPSRDSRQLPHEQQLPHEPRSCCRRSSGSSRRRSSPAGCRRRAGWGSWEGCRTSSVGPGERRRDGGTSPRHPTRTCDPGRSAVRWRGWGRAARPATRTGSSPRWRGRCPGATSAARRGRIAGGPSWRGRLPAGAG